MGSSVVLQRQNWWKESLPGLRLPFQKVFVGEMVLVGDLWAGICWHFLTEVGVKGLVYVHWKFARKIKVCVQFGIL